jgi:hypothetical protein
MGYLHTQNILSTEVIGNSLDDKINPNFLRLDDAVQFLSGRADRNLTSILTLSSSTANNFANLITATNTTTVSTFYNPSARNILSEVRNSSIDFTKVAPGMVINCVNLFVDTNSTWGAVANGEVELTPLTVTIQPKQTTSKVLIQAMINGEGISEAVFRLKRQVGSDPEQEIGTASATGAGVRNRGIAPMPFDTSNSGTLGNMYIQFYDTPSTTNVVQYKFFYRPVVDAVFYLNHTANTSDVPTNERTSSSVTLLEIKGT